MQVSVSGSILNEGVWSAGTRLVGAGSRTLKPWVER